MKNTVITLIILLVGLTCQGQYANPKKHKIQKVYTQKVFTEQDRKVLVAIAVLTPIFIGSEYFMRTRNDSMYRMSRGIFIAATIPVSIYC